MPITLPPAPPSAIIQPVAIDVSAAPMLIDLPPYDASAAAPPIEGQQTTPPRVPQNGPAAPGTTAAAPAPQPHLLGDWGGIRTDLEAAGVKPNLSYIWFPAYNLNGGTRSKASSASQLAIGATLDLDKLAGIKGGVVQATISYRSGISIDTLNHLGLLQYPQGIYGAGEIWRLAQLWYRQTIGSAEFKVGRVSMGEDFGTGACFFESLHFCGSIPGHISFSYWYNYPVSVWGARVKVTDKLGYTMGGVFEHNPTNFPENRGFYLGFDGMDGVVLPIERGFTTKLGGNPKLAGLYKLGVFYDTSRSNDLVRDVDGNYAAITHRPYASDRGRATWYAVGRQQVTVPEADGSGGTALFFNVVGADRRTNRLVNEINAGVTRTGVFAFRPKDELGLGIARAKINGRLSSLEAAQDTTLPDPHDPQHSEYAAELNYSINVKPGLSVRPNVQWYIAPGGRADRSSIVVLGTGVFVTL